MFDGSYLPVVWRHRATAILSSMGELEASWLESMESMEYVAAGVTSDSIHSVPPPPLTWTTASCWRSIWDT